MTTKTPREVIAHGLVLNARRGMPRLYREEREADDIRMFLDNGEADAILSALTAAGIGLYDTKTHVAMPREPTRVMWAAMGNAVVRTRERSGHHDHMSEAVYNAALAAAEEKPDAA